MSCVNHNYKHIYIHIPKNAGSSIEQRPYVGGDGHLTLHDSKCLITI